MRTADLNIATAELDERTRASVGRGRERGDTANQVVAAALPTTVAAGRERSDARADAGTPGPSVPSADRPHGRADVPRREHRSAA
jgi:hypothetical protein